MYFEAVFSFYVLLYHFVGHSFLGLVLFGSFNDIIKRNFSLTFAKLNFYVDMSVWLFAGKQYNRLHMARPREHVHGDAAGGGVAMAGERGEIARERAGIAGDLYD